MGGAQPAGEQAPAAARRVRLVSSATATALGALVLVLAAVSLPLSGLAHQLSILGTGPLGPVILIYAGVGVIVARRQPRNPIGWILLIFILLFLLSTDSGFYAVLYYNFGHHGLRLAQVAVLLQPLWVPAIVVFPLVILLFPDGRLTSRRWRWVMWAYAALGACVTAVLFGPAVAAVAGHHIRLDSFGDVTNTAHATGGAVAAAEVLGLVSIGRSGCRSWPTRCSAGGGARASAASS